MSRHFLDILIIFLFAWWYSNSLIFRSVCVCLCNDIATCHSLSHLLNCLADTFNNGIRLQQEEIANDRILQHCLMICDHITDDDAPLKSYWEVFIAKELKKFKRFWHVLSGTISFVIIIINFLSLMYCFFLSSRPFFLYGMWAFGVCILFVISN